MVLVVSLVASAVALFVIASLARALPGDWMAASRWKQPATSSDTTLPTETERYARRIRLSSTAGRWTSLLASMDEMGATAISSDDFETQVRPPATWRFWQRPPRLPKKLHRTYLEARIAELEHLTELESHE